MGVPLASLFLLVGGVAAAGYTELNQLETARLPQPVQRDEFGVGAFTFAFDDPDVSAVTDNEAVRQQRVDKGTNQFLATLAEAGSSQFLTVLKPCSILLPHVHQRANELYTIIFGTMNVGIAEENGFAQDTTLVIKDGEVFVVPQGLLHYNHNDECLPLVFLQSFDSADPGALNVIGALAAFADSGAAGQAAMDASGVGHIKASPQGAFALDRACLKRCGFPATGAPGDGLKDLPDAFRPLLGLDKDKKKDSKHTWKQPGYNSY